MLTLATSSDTFTPLNWDGLRLRVKYSSPSTTLSPRMSKVTVTVDGLVGDSRSTIVLLPPGVKSTSAAGKYSCHGNHNPHTILTITNSQKAVPFMMLRMTLNSKICAMFVSMVTLTLDPSLVRDINGFRLTINSEININNRLIEANQS